MQIIDNFLEPELYKNISNFLKSHHTNWWLQKDDTTVGQGRNKNGFFEFIFYNFRRPLSPKFDDLIEPVLIKLKAVSCIQIRANLTVRDVDTIDCGWHTDGSNPAATTGILYLTNCNAKTVLSTKDGEVFVDSIENRMLLFPQTTRHKVIYQTDVHKRYIVNFNFFGELCK